MIDNAGNNEVMMKALSVCKFILIKCVLVIYLLIVLIVLISTHGIEYDPSHHHLRCNGHIINLAVQAFLFPTGDDDTAFYKNSLDVPTKRELED